MVQQQVTSLLDVPQTLKQQRETGDLDRLNRRGDRNLSCIEPLSTGRKTTPQSIGHREKASPGRWVNPYVALVPEYITKDACDDRHHGIHHIANSRSPLHNPATVGAMHRIYSPRFRSMKCFAPALLQRCLRLSAATSVFCSVQAPLARSAQPTVLPEAIKIQENLKSAGLLTTTQIHDAYILGPGDSVLVELLDVPEYSGVFPIGPDGTIYLPRLRSLVVEGFTVEELRYILTQQFSAFVREPQVFVSPAAYRPIRVYIGGEVQRPGYYYLTGLQGVIGTEQANSTRDGYDLAKGITNKKTTEISNAALTGPKISGVQINNQLGLPTVFDAIRIAGGVTPFSKLNEVSVTRRRPLSKGGGKIGHSSTFSS